MSGTSPAEVAKKAVNSVYFSIKAKTGKIFWI
jgi:hypothetical protein